MAYRGGAERLNFEIDTEQEESLITSRAGMPSLTEAFRLSGKAAVVERAVKVKTHQFRDDKALVELIAYEFPTAQTARDFLDRFQEDGLPPLQTDRRRCPRRAHHCKDWRPPIRN